MFFLSFILFWFITIDAALFSTTNPYIASVTITLFSNTSSIDIPPLTGSNTKNYKYNIVPVNSTLPDPSGLTGILYDRDLSCRQNTTKLIPILLSNQPKIALVRQGGCSMTDKALYSQQDGAIATIIYSTIPFGGNIDSAQAFVTSGIFIPVYFVDPEVGLSLLNQLQQPNQVYETPNNITFQNALKVTLYPAIGGFPNAWEFTLFIVVGLLAISFLVSVGMHWHLWRIRRRQRRHYITGPAYDSMNKHTIDPNYLIIFPTRIIGINHSPINRAINKDSFNNSNINNNDYYDESNDTYGSSSCNGNDINNDGNVTTRNGFLFCQPSISNLRTERALENAEALAATIVHPKHIGEVPSIKNTSMPSNSITTEVCNNKNTNSNDTSEDNTINNNDIPTCSNNVQNETQESCVICLDEYTSGENVRRLPCGHEYHVECIDPWLTIKSASCPLCKYDCSLDIPKSNIEERTMESNYSQQFGISEETSPPSRGSSTFSLSILRRYMDNDSTENSYRSSHSGSHQNSNGYHHNNTISAFGPTISAFGPTISVDQAEAFSRTWMAKSLPRNMRRQIDLAVAAQQRENTSIELPVRMTIAQPESSLATSSYNRNNPVTIDMMQSAPISNQQQQQSYQSSQNHKKLFKSLPRQWRKN